MPVRKRTLKRRQTLSAEAQAWLDGDERGSGFFGFKPDEELQALGISMATKKLCTGTSECLCLDYWRFE